MEARQAAGCLLSVLALLVFPRGGGSQFPPGGRVRPTPPIPTRTGTIPPTPTTTVLPPTDYRLSGGDTGMGRLQVLHNDTWQYVCSRRFRVQDTNVLCRSLGFERGSPVSDWYFPIPAVDLGAPGPGSPPAGPAGPRGPVASQPALDIEFQCNGTETHLNNCPWKMISYCYNKAAVICVGPTISAGGIEEVRIVPPRNKANDTDDFKIFGRVEVYHRGRWGIICHNDNTFTHKESSIVCRKLGYQNGYKMDNSIYYGGWETRQMIWLQNIDCNTNTNDIGQCLNGTYPGEPNGGHRSCTSTYSSVTLTCYNSSKEYPLSTKDISDVRLVNVTSDPKGDWRMGRVEVKVGGRWGSVCDLERYSRKVWGHAQANVTCRMLNYASGIAVESTVFGEENSTVWISMMPCKGNERSFAECQRAIPAPSSCRTGGAGVFCFGPNVNTSANVSVSIRLVGNPDVHTNKIKAGRVEYYYMGLWGPVCQHGWDLREAYVVCRQLGFMDGYPLCNSSFGAGDGPTWLSNLNCDGLEKDLKDCLLWSQKFLEEVSCPSNGQAGVQCVDSKPEGPVSVRLVDKNKTGKDLVSGVVEVLYKGHWGTICSKNWDDLDASVVCRQLGFKTGTALTNLTIGIGTSMVWLNDVGCKGTENEITDCLHEGWAINTCALACDHTSDAGVSCSDKAPPKKENENAPGRYNVNGAVTDDKKNSASGGLSHTIMSLFIAAFLSTLSGLGQ